MSADVRSDEGDEASSTRVESLLLFLHLGFPRSQTRGGGYWRAGLHRSLPMSHTRMIKRFALLWGC